MRLQILKENKDKRDAEFNERFKHSEYTAPIALFLLFHSSYLGYNVTAGQIVWSSAFLGISE